MTLDAAKPKHRFVALDSLRGVCACFVVIFHAPLDSHLARIGFIHNSFLFVDFFFVLSGFVIGWSYGQRLSDGFPVSRFMWLRLGRVYPLHVFMLVIFIIFEIIFALGLLPGEANRTPFTGEYSIEGLLTSLLAIMIFVGPAVSWNGPAWSIAAEIWTYLIFAVLLRFLSRWTIPLCLLIALAAFVIIPTLTDHYLAVFQQGALLRCMYGFALGVIGWKILPYIERWPLRGAIVANLLELAVPIMVALFIAAAGAGPLSMIAPPVFFVAVMVFALQRGIVSRLLCTPVFVLIGTLSYSIYMIHWFMLWRFLNGMQLFNRFGVLQVLQRGLRQVTGDDALASLLFGDIMTLGFLAIVIACAYLTYKLVELPGQRFARGLVPRAPVAPPRVAPGAP